MDQRIVLDTFFEISYNVENKKQSGGRLKKGGYHG